MPHSYYQIWAHLVWATYLRQPFLTKGIRIKLMKQIKKISLEKGYHLDCINGVEDHLHCLCSLKSTQTISKLAKDFKGVSSNWINSNKLTDEVFSWQEGYSAFSVSKKDLPIVRQYIYNQEKHHILYSIEMELAELNNHEPQ